MSIPPLVCSTPPPPDQCEDDKDNEDFDIPYNLSQDEDEYSTEYNYGNYSSYDKYQPNTVSNTLGVPEVKETSVEIVNEPTKEYSPTTKNALNNNTKDSDEIIEDLDLKFDQVSINSGKLSQTDEEEVSKAESNDSLKNELGEIDDTVGTFPAVGEDAIQNENDISKDSIGEDSVQLGFVEPIDFVDQSDKTVIDLNPNEEKVFNFEIPMELVTTNNELQKNYLFECPSLDIEVVEKQAEETLEDDDFGHFDDFKFVGSGAPDQQVTAIVDSENPWGSVDEKDDFGNFKASFDEPAVSEAKFEHSTEIKVQETPDDDDFGDFDDFQSSSAAQNRHSETEQEENESVLHLESPEVHQQTVESVLSSIFEHDISNTVEVFEGKLESSLCVTWGHLLDIDVRQPYMVNWNNSLGQKTLLKALCIDSRNILFGPKWAHMPKYAANLSAAPLQPQKQSVSTSFPMELGNTEKAATKVPSDTWVDPFTSDGKEFTYAEALLLDLEHLMATLDQMAHNHSTLKISDLLHACNVENSSAAPPRPADLPVFEQATSKKAEKIYSSTLNIQPLRQINLPDTHIFTPTDSEIPRSKTIHYDSGSSVITPQPVLNAPEDEYSDFQDFKASTSIPSPPATKVTNTTDQSLSSKETASSSIAFQTSMLQPIKLETTIPTLNWPDPGQVKETFEDFSEFVSSTAWQEKQDASPSQPNTSENYTSTVISNINNRVTSEVVEVVSEENSTKASYDDDFDTFQSAISSAPIISAPKDIQGLSLPSHNGMMKSIDSLPTSTLKKSPDFDINFPAFGDLSNSISHTNTLTQIETPPITESYIPNNFTSKIGTSQLPQMPQLQKAQTVSPPSGTQINTQVLQPTRFSSSTQSKPASGQILQPLSLEGYSQINWPNPGDTLDLSDLSRFNPVETLPSLKRDLNVGNSKTASPAHSHKSKVSDDDWGDFVSSEPKQSAPQATQPAFVDNDEWTDFFSCSSTQPHNGLNTISLNVHTNLNIQKTANQTKYNMATNQIPLEIPKLNYVTPKTNHHRAYSDRHFQNL